MQRLKEPNIPQVDFSLQSTGFEELISLPQPKPPELLDIQEDNRKGRLLDSLNKIGGGLEDSSLDFIRRDNFDKGGVAKVFAHLDSLPEGTEIDLNYIRKYIGDNNINASAENVFKQFDKINLKQIAGSGNETFTYGKEKRDQLTRLKNKLKIKKLTTYIPATKENLDKLDDLIKNTDLNVEQIGEKMGYENPKSFKLAPTTKNVLTKAYLKKYGSPPEGRFKVKKLDPESKYVKDVINLKEQGVNTTQIANKFDKTRMAIVNVFRKMGREDLIDDVNEKKEGTPESRKKAARTANIKEGEKFASKADKAFNKKEKKRVKKINAFLKNNPDQLANNQKFINLVNLKLDGKGNIISKNKSSEEVAKLLKKDRLFERDHISSVAKRKRNMQFPVNFQMAPYNINQGFFGAAEAYVNRPDADPEKIKKISNVLDQYGLRLSTNKGTIGAKQIPASEVINRNLKALDIDPNIGSNIKMKKVSLNDSKNIAKQLASFGFKCSAAEGGACDNPMNYLDDIKKQQTLAKGSGNAAANAVKKLSAGKTIMREFIGPAALGFELAAAIPITYLGYKAGLPPARIFSDATYGLIGDTEKARLKKIAVDEGIDTSGLDKVFEFQDKSKAIQTIASQEQDFRGPDDEFQYQQQYDKGEEDFYKSIGQFTDEEGNVSKKVYDNLLEQLKRVEDIAVAQNTATAAERSSKIPTFGIGDYIDFNAEGRVNYSNGSDGTALAIEESLEAFQRYLKAGGKLGYKDFISLGNEGVSKFFNAGGRVGFADGPDNPKRRTFIKVMAGIASLPILGKFFKGAKTGKVVKLANTTTNMPDWFPQFVENAFAKGIGKKIDADLTELEVPELPGVKVLAHDDGRIRVEGKNAYDETYEIEYTPPGYEVVDEATGKTVKTSGEFQAMDTQFRRTGSPDEMDFDVDYEVVKDVDDILGGNATQLEGFAKGTNKTKETRGSNLVDKAEADLERADIYDPYEGVDGSDFTDD